MTKMSKAQQTAILDAHDRRTRLIGRGTVSADLRVVKILRREGWVSLAFGAFDVPTTAGLIAAGVDMDAIHTEALAENAQREMDEATDERDSPRGRHFLVAVREGKSYRAALDVLHAEARVEDYRRRLAAARQGRPEALEGTLGGPEMILAVLRLRIEQEHTEALAENAQCRKHVAEAHRA